MYLVIICLTMTACALFLYHSSTNRSTAFFPPTSSNTEDTPDNAKSRFSGFTIQPGRNCCQAAFELQRMTFLQDDDITIPLHSCNKGSCTCRKTDIKDRRKYDRRSTLERRNEFRFTTGEIDRRIVKGRRQQDNIWSGGYTY